MYIRDGIVYGGEPVTALKVIKIKVLPDKIMLITFSNHETRLFDGTILREGVFKKLQDEALFNSAKVDHGIVSWMDGEIDCAPEFMYKNSYEYPPLENTETNEWYFFKTDHYEEEDRRMSISLT